MATVTFDSMVLQIAPQVPGCPTAVISATIRKIATDLCERAKVWRVALTPVVLVSGTYNYSLVSPTAGTEVSSIIAASMALTTTKAKKNLIPVTGDYIFNADAYWPDVVNLNEPRFIFRLDESSFNLSPVPGTADTYTLNMYAAIRPTLAGTTIDSGIASQYQREIYHGVLHELMMIPDRVWSDDKKSLYHGKQWTFLLNSAKARANKGFGRTNITVNQSPWA